MSSIDFMYLGEECAPRALRERIASLAGRKGIRHPGLVVEGLKANLISQASTCYLSSGMSSGVYIPSKKEVVFSSGSTLVAGGSLLSTYRDSSCDERVEIASVCSDICIEENEDDDEGCSATDCLLADGGSKQWTPTFSPRSPPRLIDFSASDSSEEEEGRAFRALSVGLQKDLRKRDSFVREQGSTPTVVVTTTPASNLLFLDRVVNEGGKTQESMRHVLEEVEDYYGFRRGENLSHVKAAVAVLRLFGDGMCEQGITWLLQLAKFGFIRSPYAFDTIRLLVNHGVERAASNLLMWHSPKEDVLPPIFEFPAPTLHACSRTRREVVQ